MKTIVSFILIAIALFSTTYAKERNASYAHREVKQIIPITDLTSKMTLELLGGQHPDVVVECKEGTNLPFMYLGDFGLFSVKFNPNLSIKIEKTCYLRVVQKSPLKKPRTFLSYDLKSWSRASQFLKKGGLLSSLGMSEDKSHVVLDTSLLPIEEDASE